mmetsp:Transcript_120110/g.384688  ORF Transcript_120110/g.384688 Transcript_120110/m.384688 type:complete len:542 (-) Transcript_120110:20-1645(-)
MQKASSMLRSPLAQAVNAREALPRTRKSLSESRRPERRTAAARSPFAKASNAFSALSRTAASMSASRCATALSAAASPGFAARPRASTASTRTKPSNEQALPAPGSPPHDCTKTFVTAGFECERPAPPLPPRRLRELSGRLPAGRLLVAEAEPMEAMEPAFESLLDKTVLCRLTPESEIPVLDRANTKRFLPPDSWSGASLARFCGVIGGEPQEGAEVEARVIMTAGVDGFAEPEAPNESALAALIGSPPAGASWSNANVPMDTEALLPGGSLPVESCSSACIAARLTRQSLSVSRAATKSMVSCPVPMHPSACVELSRTVASSSPAHLLAVARKCWSPTGARRMSASAARRRVSRSYTAFLGGSASASAMATAPPGCGRCPPPAVRSESSAACRTASLGSVSRAACAARAPRWPISAAGTRASTAVRRRETSDSERESFRVLRRFFTGRVDGGPVPPHLRNFSPHARVSASLYSQAFSFSGSCFFGAFPREPLLALPLGVMLREAARSFFAAGIARRHATPGPPTGAPPTPPPKGRASGA